MQQIPDTEAGYPTISWNVVAIHPPTNRRTPNRLICFSLFYSPAEGTGQVMKSVYPCTRHSILDQTRISLRLTAWGGGGCVLLLVPSSSSNLSMFSSIIL